MDKDKRDGHFQALQSAFAPRPYRQEMGVLGLGPVEEVEQITPK
tara:strand:- start:195 stop:326 length:132 start_codon:yes stop_codon:yes gene_type:complete